MEYLFHIDPNLDVPLYRQLVDMLQTAIKKGRLAPGQKLPTVQELSQQLAIARGTIKRAYDELEREGFLEKVQGRGTFVCYQPMNSGSRKEMAMAAIDDMLNQLEKMGLSPAEINIFLNLKLRERAEQDAKIKVVVVEDAPENVNQIASQLRRMEDVDLYTHLMDSLRQYPFQLGDDFDLLITTPGHESFLQQLLPPKKRVTPVALRPSSQCLKRILQLPAGTRVGIAAYSDVFARQLAALCREFAPEAVLSQSLVCGPDADLSAYLRNLDRLLLPRSYDKYFSAQDLASLEAFSGELIPCAFELDNGSMLYLEAKLRRLMDAKSL